MQGLWVICRRIVLVWLYERHLSQHRYPKNVSLLLVPSKGRMRVLERESQLTSALRASYLHGGSRETYSRIGDLEIVSTLAFNIASVTNSSPSGVPGLTDSGEQ